MIKTQRFDIVKYLDSDEAIAIYLHEIAEIAQKSGLARESIYKALTDGTKPRFDTIMQIMQALNLKQIMR